MPPSVEPPRRMYPPIIHPRNHKLEPAHGDYACVKCGHYYGDLVRADMDVYCEFTDSMMPKVRRTRLLPKWRRKPVAFVLGLLLIIWGAWP